VNSSKTKTRPIPAGVDWFVHRVASSDRYSSGLAEILYGWTLEQVLDANMVLDTLDALGSQE